MARFTKVEKALIAYVAGKLKNNTTLGGTAHYGLVHAKGRHIINPNSACHAGLRTNEDYAKGVVAVVTMLSVGHGLWRKTKRVDKIRMIDYLLNRSPYSPAFLDTSAEGVYRRGYFVIDPTVSGWLVGGACVATRVLWEQYGQTIFWNALVKAGVPESLAFVIAFSSSVGNGSVALGTQGPGHCVLNPPGGIVGAARFVLNRPSPRAYHEIPYNQSGKFDGYSSDAFGSGGGAGWLSILEDVEVVEAKVNGVPATNPFSDKIDAIYGKRKSRRIDDVVAAVVKAVPAIMEKLTNA